jgi:hypothetical protein
MRGHVAGTCCIGIRQREPDPTPLVVRYVRTPIRDIGPTFWQPIAPTQSRDLVITHAGSVHCAAAAAYCGRRWSADVAGPVTVVPSPMVDHVNADDNAAFLPERHLMAARPPNVNNQAKGKGERPTARARPHEQAIQEQALEAGLLGTFPASDAVAVVQPAPSGPTSEPSGSRHRRVEEHPAKSPQA